MDLTHKHVDVMLAAEKQPGWRPAWRGALKRCRELEQAGLMKECGVSAMPPHVVFSLTQAGQDAMLKFCAENF